MTLQLDGDQRWLRAEMMRLCAATGGIPNLPGRVKLKVLDYQLLALAYLTRPYNDADARILEIGTGHGGSGLMLAKAAPRARILSLTTSATEAVSAAIYWRQAGCHGIRARVAASWDYLAANDDEFALVFVDGDHNRIARDLPWFNRTRVGGLFLCHDYSPTDSRTPSAIVFAELNRVADILGRPFDVRIVDEGKVGMVGFYRRVGETL